MSLALCFFFLLFSFSCRWVGGHQTGVEGAPTYQQSKKAYMHIYDWNLIGIITIQSDQIMSHT